MAHYAGLSGRNQEHSESYQRKIQDRLQTLSNLLTNGQNVLEIGCAEGGLAAAVRTRFDLHYDGIEPSKDAGMASSRLDRIFSDVTELPPENQYDVVMAFHVLEHIDDVNQALKSWQTLLKPGGQLLLEVPNRSGNPLLAIDQHHEHQHQFSALSLLTLIEHAGLEVSALTTGHFESPLYRDSIRLVASPVLSHVAREQALQEICQRLFPAPVLIYGIGGDFQNCVLPILSLIPVAGLRDKSTQRHGTEINGHLIEAFDPARDRHLPVLVASLHFQDEIVSELQSMGVASEQITTLSNIYDA
jgi:AraC-like DNA-binding protein